MNQQVLSRKQLPRPPLLHSIRSRLADLERRYFLTALERGLRRAYGTRAAQAAGPIVTIQCVENLFYFCLFGEIIRGLRRQGPIRVEQIVVRGMRGASEGRGMALLKRKLWRLVRSNILTDNKWVHIFNSYANGIAYRSAMPLMPWIEWQIALRAKIIWGDLTSKDSLAVLEIDGIPVGDLIADTYLRMRPSPVLDINDPFMLVVIRQALRDLYKAFRYFGRVQPALLLTSYTSYVEHGIASRVASFLGIRVQSFGNYLTFSKHIIFGDHFHQPRFTRYRADFQRLDRQEERITLGSAPLAARLSGEIDLASAYMKSSAYGGTKIKLPDMQGAVIIFLHDFYDSPHAYEWMLFHDFWEWLCFTIETLRDASIPFFLKAHPNQIAASAADLARLEALYPGLQMLPPSVSNHQLVEAGMSCAVTVYGTVASEMAYMGVPTISCADNPHIDFDFGLTARTREEYRAMLAGHADLPRDAESMRKEAGAFYYFHNLHLEDHHKEIRDKFVRINLKMTDADQQHCWTDESVLGDFRDLSAAPGFHEFADKLATYIRAVAAASHQS